MVEPTGFEPVTSCLQGRRSAKNELRPQINNYQREEISSSLPGTCMTAVIALVDNLRVLSLIHPQLAGVCDGILTRMPLGTSFLSRRVYETKVRLSPRILNFTTAATTALRLMLVHSNPDLTSSRFRPYCE